MEEGDYQNASSSFADAIIEYPKCVEYLVHFVMSLYHLRDRRSLENASKVLARIPQKLVRLEEQFLFGHTLELLGQYNEAKQAYFHSLDIAGPMNLRNGKIAKVHEFLTGLSERHNFEIGRPRHFNSPYYDMKRGLTYHDRWIEYRLRTFLTKHQEVRLITFDDYQLTQKHPDIKVRAISDAKVFFEEPYEPFISPQVVWIFHYVLSSSGSHRLEGVRDIKEKYMLEFPLMKHDNFERVSGYRLLWSLHHK